MRNSMHKDGMQRPDAAAEQEDGSHLPHLSISVSSRKKIFLAVALHPPGLPSPHTRERVAPRRRAVDRYTLAR